MDHCSSGRAGEDRILTIADSCAEAIRVAEAALLEVAYAWAVVNDPDRLDPAEARLPGREKARLYGGAGTPQVCEFAAAELGGRIGRTTYAAAHRIKTHGSWQVQQPFPGIYVWRDPHGRIYLVDHTGTRRLKAG